MKILPQPHDKPNEVQWEALKTIFPRLGRHHSCHPQGRVTLDTAAVKLLARGRFQLSCLEETSRMWGGKKLLQMGSRFFLCSLSLHLEEKNKCSRGEDELASAIVGKNENESTSESNSQLSIPDVSKGAWKHTNTSRSLSPLLAYKTAHKNSLKMSKTVDELLENVDTFGAVITFPLYLSFFITIWLRSSPKKDERHRQLAGDGLQHSQHKHHQRNV